jgi:hypothetical protein
MNAQMSEKERTIWEQAVRVLRENSVSAVVTGEYLEGKRILAKAREQAASRRRKDLRKL